MATLREFGYIVVWGESRSGGWGIIRGRNRRKYFFHQTQVLKGEPIQGRRVIFTPLPKALGERSYRATEVEVLEPGKN
jgi:hypothetical protein